MVCNVGQTHSPRLSDTAPDSRLATVIPKKHEKKCARGLFYLDYSPRRPVAWGFNALGTSANRRRDGWKRRRRGSLASARMWALACAGRDLLIKRAYSAFPRTLSQSQVRERCG